MLHGVVDFRHAWVIAPASEKGRESKQRDGGGEFRLLAAEIAGCSHQRRWVCALRGGTLDSDVEKPGVSSRPQTICPCRRGFPSDPGASGGGPGPGMCKPESGRPIGSSRRWPHAGHNIDSPHPSDRARSIASHKTGRWTFRRSRDLCCCAPLLQTRSRLPIIPDEPEPRCRISARTITSSVVWPGVLEVRRNGRPQAGTTSRWMFRLRAGRFGDRARRTIPIIRSAYSLMRFGYWAISPQRSSSGARYSTPSPAATGSDFVTDLISAAASLKSADGKNSRRPAVGIGVKLPLELPLTKRRHRPSTSVYAPAATT